MVFQWSHVFSDMEISAGLDRLFQLSHVFSDMEIWHCVPIAVVTSCEFQWSHVFSDMEIG